MFERAVPKKMMIDITEGKKSLSDVLGTEMQDKAKLRQIQQKYQGYGKPAPKRNDGYRTSQEEYLL